jgi:hypothetical protein
MQYTDNEAALIGGLISNYFFQPVYPHHLPGHRSGGQRYAAGRAATENPSAAERGHSVPSITQKKGIEGVDLSTPSQPG